MTPPSLSGPCRFRTSLAFLLVAGLSGAAAAAVQPGDDSPPHAAGPSQGTVPDSSRVEEDKSPPPWVVSAPHGPADTVRFETDEGTWISVDVSPDGRTLVFDLLGDLYLLPRGGGEAEQLTSGLAYDFQPRFAPNGKRVLFTSDRGGSDNLWLIGTDGSDPRPLTSEKDNVVNSGAWSPDGDYVVARKRLTDYSSIGAVELWLYHLSGGKGIRVTEKTEVPDANGPTFSADGRWIIFAARGSRYRYNRNVYAGIWQLRAYDRETGNLRPLTDGSGGSGRPQVSPDGKTLSFIRRDRAKTLLVLHDLESGRERVLFEGLDYDMQENFAWTGTYPGYSWTPDGSEIVISFGGGIHAVRVADGSARRIPFRAPVTQHVTRALRFPQDIGRETIRVRMVSWPTSSPAGDDLVFSALGRLYRMDLPDGTPSPLRSEGPRAYAPTFSADGRRIAYVTWGDTEGGRVWVMDGLGGRSRSVTGIPGQYANPVFSPDGSRLAFLKGSGATARGRNLGSELWFDVLWVPVRGGTPRYVITTNNRGSSRHMPRLTFSPDGSRIFYVEEKGAGEKARTHLVSVRLDGTDRQDHLKIRHAEEILPSPDGRWVAFTRLHQGFLAPLPTLGKEPVELSGEGDPLPVHRFSRDGADWLTWSPAGDAIGWSRGPFVHRLSLEEVLAVWDAEKARAAARAEPGGDEKESEETGESIEAHPDTVEVVLEVPRSRPEGTFALVGARLLTMRGNEVIEPGTVVVENDRIAAVGPEGEVPVPDGARVFDVSGKTILPGFVDSHAHMHYSDLEIIPETISSYYANLAYGVTTTHDPSASTYAVFTQSEMVEAGVTLGPRIFSTGFILYGADLPNMAPIQNLEDARRHVRRLKNLGAFTVKSYMQPRREQRQWVIEAAREESVMVHPEGAGNLEMDLSMVLDGHSGIEHSLPVTPLYRDVVTLLARSGTGYTPTLLVAYGGLSGEHWFYQHHEVWKDEKLLRFLPRGQVDARSRRRTVMAPDDDWHHMEVAAGCKAVVEAGGRVQLGAHGQLQGLGVHWELWALTQGGMSSFDALRCATIYGAEYLGMDRWIGSLEPGKLADLVILQGNPLQDIVSTNTVRFVVKNGEMYDGDTMDRLWPAKRPRPPFFWEVQGEMLSRTR